MTPMEYVFEEEVAIIISETMFGIELERGEFIAEKWLEDIIDSLDIICKQPFPYMYLKIGNTLRKVTKNGKKIYFKIVDRKIVVKAVIF